MDRAVSDYLAGVGVALGGLDLDCLRRIADRIYTSHRAGLTTYCMGNGGSAATATHLASDLSRMTTIAGRERQVRVVSLCANSSLLTACGNDQGFDEVFVEQLRGVLRPGDVLIGASTSGRSPNVVNALRYAHELGAVAIVLTGLGGAQLRDMADEVLVIESTHVQVIEDLTMMAAHVLCLLTRERRISAGD